MREAKILDAYHDYRGALKHSEVMALEVLKKAEARLEAAKKSLGEASQKVAGFSGTDPADRAKLELARDEELRNTQEEEKRYQIAKDLSDNMTISYNTSEVIMARLMQTTSAKERVYSQAVSFFSTNDSVLRRVGIERATAAIVLLSDPRATKVTIRHCRRLSPAAAVPARAMPTIKGNRVNSRMPADTGLAIAAAAMTRSGETPAARRKGANRE